MSGKRNSRKNNLPQTFVYDDEQNKNEEPAPFVSAKREESMGEIFDLNENKTFSKDEKPVKVFAAWGQKK